MNIDERLLDLCASMLIKKGKKTLKKRGNPLTVSRHKSSKRPNKFCNIIVTDIGRIAKF